MQAAAQRAALSIAAGRVLVGAALLGAPALAEPWAGKLARRAGGQMIIRTLGVRDAALGLGALVSASQPRQLRRWLVLSAACDAIDFAATLRGPRSPARSLVLASAAAAAAANLTAAASERS
ncbi:MAG: hypothetical protein JO244_01360 [Solirubrobacterales bacterium]|nr:hypothetical protein [Solirubrobacterales bacterium]